MYKPKIYIETSVIDSIFKAENSVRSISKKLISKCKNQEEFEGYISSFTIIELNQKYSTIDFTKILKYLDENDVKLIKYLQPKEIDYLVKHYEHKSILPIELQHEYYHIATCAYLNIEYFISWNIESITNYKNFKNVIYCHVPRGYRSIFQFRTPEYFVAQKCTSNLREIIAESLEIKRKQYSILNNIELEQQAAYQEEKAFKVIEDNIQSKILPESINKAARIPTLEVGKSSLKFITTNYKDDINKKKIPLLDLDYETIGMDVHYELIKLEVTEGQEELKNRQLELIYHLPTQYSQEELNKINQERNKIFIDWVLPEIKTEIDNNQKEFNEIPKEWIRRYHYREIDQNLANSIRGESLELIKTKAIELNKLITQKAWQYYRGFSFPGQWCKFNDGYDHGEFTHIITEKDGKEIWLIFINEIIP